MLGTYDTNMSFLSANTLGTTQTGFFKVHLSKIIQYSCHSKATLLISHAMVKLGILQKQLLCIRFFLFYLVLYSFILEFYISDSANLFLPTEACIKES